MNFLPPPPPAIETEQSEDVRPALPVEAQTSEQAYEQWLSDTLDWGDRRNLLAYRWCKLYSGFATEALDCGDKPDGVE